MQENGKTKTTLCINMLQLLNSGRVFKVSELANLLETNPRNIIEYKRELEDAGYFIVSIPGKFGGYQLDKSSIIPSLKLTEEEKKILQVASDYLNARGDFLDAELYQKAIAKIFSSMNTLPLVDETFIIPGVTLVMSNEELHKRYATIEKCISKKTKISIDFLSTDNVVRTRIIHPYKLFMFNNAWFVIGYCELANDIRYFKLNRIESFTEVNQKFRVLLSYNERDYFDKTGFKIGIDWSKNSWDGASTKVEGDWVHIKLELSGKPAMYVKEYKYGENQIVTPIDKDATILECDMHYKYNTVKFVLGFGADCKVLEPKWLKEEVVSIAQKMINNS